MGGSGSPHRRATRIGAIPGWLLVLLAAPAAQAAASPTDALRQALAAVCEAPSSSLAQMAGRIPGARGEAEEPRVVRGTDVGWERRFALPGGAEIRVDRFAPRGRLRRLSVEYWTPAPEDGVRPLMAAVADADCAIRRARRLAYQPDFPQPVAIEHLDRALEPTGERTPLNPPVPDGADPGGVAVALVDAGVNYRLPEIADRLARDDAGAILGYDYWDMDARPFDAHPARSPFFPQRHGTRTAALLLREAPAARLVPYRYPRPDMSRMGVLVADAADQGIGIASISMGSNERSDWEAFAAAARAHPEVLFVVSAGNNGRDIDAQPVYPAALPLENVVVVTSARNDGGLARGSNWGRTAVDLLVPAERLAVTGFDGEPTSVSGASYAAPRIAALAARLRAQHPGWRAPQLKEAIFARVLPPFAGASEKVAQGFMPRPDKAERLPPLTGDGQPGEVARHRLAGEALGTGAEASADLLLEPTFAYFRGTGWNPDALRRHAWRAAEILGQCGVRIPRVDVRVLEGPEVFHYFHDAIGRELVRRLELPKPTVYFVRDTLQVHAYDAEAIGEGNSATRPELRDTIWFTEGTPDPGAALAHELVHILMNSGRHVDAPGNLMHAETAPSNTGLTPKQCEAMAAQGVSNGLLESAGAR